MSPFSRANLSFNPARVAIETTVDKGVAVINKLDAIMKNKYANDPATLAEWRTASRTERAPRRKKPPTALGTGGESNAPPTGG